MDVIVAFGGQVDYKFDFTTVGEIDCVLFSGDVCEVGFVGRAEFQAFAFGVGYGLEYVEAVNVVPTTVITVEVSAEIFTMSSVVFSLTHWPTAKLATKSVPLGPVMLEAATVTVEVMATVALEIVPRRASSKKPS